MEPDRTSSIDRVFITLIITTFAVLIAAAAVLARRHLRSDSADRRGAWRITTYMAIAGVVAWIVRASHSSNLEGEIGLFVRAAGDLALLAVIVWTVYVALEPYVRKLWPDALLGWSRLLAGHIKDPRVGYDVLVGVVFGLAISLISVGKAMIVPALGFAAPYPQYGFAEAMFGDGSAALWGALLESVSAIGGALFAVLGIVILRLVLRRQWLILIVTAFFLSLIAIYDINPGFPWSLAFPLASGVLLTTVALRFGLLALAVTWFVKGILEAVPMTLDVSHWSASASNWTLALLIGLTLFGFYASRAGQPLFGSILED